MYFNIDVRFDRIDSGEKGLYIINCVTRSILEERYII